MPPGRGCSIPKVRCPAKMVSALARRMPWRAGTPSPKEFVAGRRSAGNRVGYTPVVACVRAAKPYLPRGRQRAKTQYPSDTIAVWSLPILRSPRRAIANEVLVRVTNQMTRDSLVANDGQWGGHFVKNSRQRTTAAFPATGALAAGFPRRPMRLKPKNSFGDQSGHRSCRLTAGRPV